MLRRNRSAGFTYVEMVVAAALASVLIAIFTTTLVRVMRVYQFSEQEAIATSDITRVVNRVSRVLRGLSSVETATASEVVGYGYFTPGDATPSKIRYFVSGTSLQVGVIPASGSSPNYTYDPAQETVATLLGNLVDGGTATFRYYDETGTQLPAAFAASQVKQIGLYVAANPDPTRLPKALANETRITLRNRKTNL